MAALLLGSFVGGCRGFVTAAPHGQLVNIPVWQGCSNGGSALLRMAVTDDDCVAAIGRESHALRNFFTYACLGDD